MKGTDIHEQLLAERKDARKMLKIAQDAGYSSEIIAGWKVRAHDLHMQVRASRKAGNGRRKQQTDCPVPSDPTIPTIPTRPVWGLVHCTRREDRREMVDSIGPMRYVGDCVTRAFANYLGESYNEIWHTFAKLNSLDRRMARRLRKRTGTVYTADAGVMSDVWGAEAMRRGMKCVYRTRHGRGPSLKAVAEYWGDCLVQVRGHVVAIKGGKLVDSWDSRRKPVRSVWKLA